MAEAASGQNTARVLGQVGQKRKLGEILVDQKLLTQEQVDYATRKAEKDRVLIGNLLLSEGLITEVDLARCIAIQAEMPFMDLAGRRIPQHIVRKMPEGIVRQHLVLPVELQGDLTIVAVADPRTTQTNEAVRNALPQPCELRVSPRSQIEALITGGLENDREKLETLAYQLAQNSSATSVTIDQFMDRLIQTAIRHDASDIHLDPAESFLRLRERIDGVLQETADLDLGVHQTLMSKLKVNAGLDITEKRKPQDGRFRYKLNQRMVDIRLSTLPTIRGERAVMRILDKSKFKVKLDEIGIDAVTVKNIRELLKRPHGIILVTGPTGSGKTTTTYAMLSEINDSEVNIITVEDPVEYQFDIINQVQIAPKAGLHFADLLRNILRQDPDVIMVGEVRDNETAEIAVRAALTGHLVISTIHTNDSVSTISRLIDMGVEPFLLASSITGIISQRLIRLLCNFCKKPRDPAEGIPPAISAGMSEDQKRNARFYSPSGCDNCNNTGYRGRTAIAEMFVPDDTIRKGISEGMSRVEMLDYLEKAGFVSLRRNALDKAIEGITSIDEVIKTTI